MPFEINRLIDSRQHTDIVHAWHSREWGEEWARTISDSVKTEGFPNVYVAFDDGIPVGTAILTNRDMTTRPDIKHWLGGVYVLPAYRNKGIGTKLVNYAMNDARKTGIKKWWLYTANSRAMYERLGWVFHSEVEYEGETVTLMTYEFD